MNGVNIVIQPSALASMTPSSATITHDDSVVSPLNLQGTFVPDLELPIEERAEKILQQYGVDYPEKKNYLISNNMQDHEQILALTRLAQFEFKDSMDKTSNLIASMSAEITKTEDGRSHIKSIKELIDNINSNYQKSFGEITKGATKYMETLNKALGLLSTYISAGKDGKIHFNRSEFDNQFMIALKDYVIPKTGTAWDAWREPVIDDDRISNFINPIASISAKEGMASFFKKKLEGQGFIVKEIDGQIKIYPDFNVVKEIKKIVDDVGLNGDGDLISQAFQSMQTAIDSKKNSVNNSVSRLLEAFRQDNSHFETLTQLLIQLLKDLFQYNAGFANT
ncbi:TPA: hypothetical protein ACHWKL_000538 [Providencia stuartii]|uniref:hypothetical protein n=1 Tax=Providencia stuartii TaxID=588 RepID=UPI00113FCC65|nr:MULTISPECIES: hypothetical protein [Providencia]MBN5562186.1 hypothetical protein [Providencia stuartii]MBN5602202.1 hypothetical protein [Providencia stuartii]MBN5606248.1 hypothetical protein [Providencia stuartii]MCL8324683.1 hypothetical protein [Providencia thailandensis]MDF4172653.1 hypothetical protein [Providencia thailandensis]